MSRDDLRVRLVSVGDARNSRSVEAWLTDDGSLVISGQDLGATPLQFFGSTEYEWQMTVGAHDVPRLLGALGGPAGVDVLEILEQRCRADERHATTGWMEEHDIPFTFWSRVGD